VVRAAVGHGEEVETEAAVPLGDGFAGRVAAGRVPVIASALAPGESAGSGLPASTRSIVGVPLVASERLVGVLNTGTIDPREFGGDDVLLLSLVADRVAHTIERAQILESEQRARAEAESANRAKMDFLAMMSHELRTPLNAIAGYAELLELGLRGPVTEQQVKDLQSIRRNERHLLALIEEVLNFAKLDAGRVELDIREVRIRAALESVVSMVSPQIQEKEHVCVVDETDPTLIVHADLEKLQQILVNLLSNAVKFTDRGGRITLSAEAQAGGREVAIHVRDTGIGIPADQQQRIFEPFVQLDSGLTRRAHGTGLGLAISRELARAMRGELSVRSAPGTGSEFTLLIQRAPDVSEA
jgi:signal transduction histidine kinase